MMLDLQRTRTPSGEEIRSVEAAEYLQSRLRDASEAVEERAFKMIQSFAEQGAKDAWLVELRLPWTKERPIILLMLVTRSQGRFEVTRSVVQVPYAVCFSFICIL
jgi:hypothetical protein